MSLFYHDGRRDTSLIRDISDLSNMELPFRKVMTWDALFFVLGFAVGAGIGALLAAN